MNYPMVEFCRACGESLHTKPDMTNNGLLVKWTHHAIDAMFWLVDETVRWWEIGRLSIRLKSLRRQRASLLDLFESEENFGSEASLEQKQSLVGITEELARLSSREEFVRSRCWAIAPELMFVGIFVVFLYGILAMNPVRSLLPKAGIEPGIFSGQVSRVRDLPLTLHSVITCAEWFDNKLYIGGDGGLTVVDPATGQASAASELPDDFFVRDLVINDNSLFIAGFPGIYILENTVIKPMYRESQLPVKLVNTLAVTGYNRLLIGTIGSGLLRGNDDSAVMVLGTHGRTIRDFGRQGNELWIMHEDGILTGRGDSFETLNLQVLAGRHLRRMVTTDRNVFIGTDEGVVAGYRNSRNWVWTLLSAGRPGYVNDLIVSGDNLFIGSDEGVYRFSKGRMERLSSIPCQALALTSSFLAAVNPESIMMFYFAGSTQDISGTTKIPEIGTFTQVIPVVSLLPLPGLQVGRLPDFRQLEQASETSALTESAAATATFSPLERPHVPLPTELQRPVFSGIARKDNKFLLTTKNRGAWTYDGNAWYQVSGVPQTGAHSMARNSSNCFVYGSSAGVYQIIDNAAQLMISATETQNLLHLSANEDNSLLLLFRDGSIKHFKNDIISDKLKIPDEFAGEFHSLWEIDKRCLVLVDKGVLLHESEHQWNLVFFKGRLDNLKVVAAEPGPDKNLFIALNDGRIFEYTAGKLDFTGVIDDQPVSLNYEGCLWVAGRDSLYFLENKSFVTTPFHTKDLILGAFPQIDKNNLLVFTDAGVNLLSGRQ
ncbi:MAG: hypothetical protein CVV42_03740 [Candidatus Riflebacteria bacterium HGW-Riflebacteria-2]|nr:MAG: hypothetical protein CVV42_03740 [Candidatus Riflebacteria bacterium HGW-Riflebacteria-2]